MPPALDFPASPTVGQKYPSPAVTGVPVYSWDGEKWTTLGGAIGSTGASDAIPLIDAGTGAAGSSTLWSRGDHVHPPISTSPTPPPGDNDTSIATTAFVSNAVTTAVGGIPGAPSAVVRYDIAQTLTAPQLIQARQNIYAAPFDAMAYSGLQINGGMEVSQELGTGGISISGANKYIVDGWAVQSVGTQVANASQNVGCPPGYIASVACGFTTANASPAAGHYCTFLHKIEGWRIGRLGWGTANAQPLTLSFWVFANRAGNYSGSVSNGASNRSYPFTFTINAAAAWEYKTVTIPGDTSGTWTKDNTIGMQISLAMMVGSTYQAPAGAWTSGIFLGTTGTINGVAATSDAMLLTGVTVLPGNEAPSAARSPFVMRSYDQELVTCRRYLQTPQGWSTTGFTAASTIVRAGFMFSPIMRATPTLMPLNGALVNINTTSANVTANNITLGSNHTPGPGGMWIDLAVVSGITAGQACVVSFGVGSLQFDARL